MFLATLDTSSYSFMAAGRTRAAALDALRAGWERHADQTGATLRWDELADDVYVIRLLPGVCLRERRPI